MNKSQIKSAFEKLHTLPVVLIMDHSRAGNVFFMRVFDQHPHMHCVPFVNYFFSSALKIFNGRESCSFDTALEILNGSDFGEIYRDIDDSARRKFQRMGDDIDGPIDREQVRHVIHTVLADKTDITIRDLVAAYNLAYSIGTGQVLDEKQCVVMADSLSDAPSTLRAYFDGAYADSRIIHLVRDPRACFASVRHQYVSQHGSMYPITRPFSRNMTFGYGGVWLYAMVSALGGAQALRAWEKTRTSDTFKRVRNEDINIHFVETMQGLSEWLGVPFHDYWADEDYYPTSNGRLWLGISAYSANFTLHDSRELTDEDKKLLPKPNREVTERWKKRVTPSELALIEALLHDEMKVMGYTPHQSSGPISFWSTIQLSLPLFSDEWPTLNFTDSIGHKEKTLERLLRPVLLPVMYIFSRFKMIFFLKHGAFRVE